MSQLQAFGETRNRLAEEQKATNIERLKEDEAVRLKREGEDEALRLKRQEEDRIFDRKTTQLLLATHASDERAKPPTKDDNNAGAQKHDDAPSKNDNAPPAAANPLKFRETTTEHVRNHQFVLWLNNKVHKPGYYVLECCWCEFSERLSEVVEPINALFSHARHKHGNKSKGPDILAQYGINAYQPLLEYCAIQVTDADKEWFSLRHGANRKKVNAKDNEVDAAYVESFQHSTHQPQKPASISKEGGKCSNKLVEGRKRGRDDFEDDMPAEISPGESSLVAPAKRKVSYAAPKSLPGNFTPDCNNPANDSHSDDPLVTLGEDEEGEEEYVPPSRKRNIFGSY